MSTQQTYPHIFQIQMSSKACYGNLGWQMCQTWVNIRSITLKQHNTCKLHDRLKGWC